VGCIRWAQHRSVPISRHVFTKVNADRDFDWCPRAHLSATVASSRGSPKWAFNYFVRIAETPYYAFQTVEYSDKGNLLQRFLSRPLPKCFLYGSENRHLLYLQRLRESDCTVIENTEREPFFVLRCTESLRSGIALFRSVKPSESDTAYICVSPRQNQPGDESSWLVKSCASG
jgi:hypothetical protein